jgi:hypothetical protein
VHTKPTSLVPLNESTDLSNGPDYYRRILHKIIDVGAELIDLIQTEAKAQSASLAAAPQPATEASEATRPDLSVAFDRVARAVRRTIMLATKITENANEPANGVAQSRAAARRRIIRVVEDTVQREARGAHGDTLLGELGERLDDPGLDDEIDHRPINEVITDICRDLGLTASIGTHPWKRRTPEDVAELCARAAGPGLATGAGEGLLGRPGAGGAVRAVGPPGGGVSPAR